MSLNSKQKEKLAQFRELTGTSEKEAKTILINSYWSLESAIEVYYSKENSDFAVPSTPSTNKDLLEALFSRYKSQSSNEIEREGIQDFCNDIEIDPLDPVILVFAYYCKAEVMGVFKKNEFLQGMIALGCDSIAKLKAKVPDLRRVLNDPREFRMVYNYVFNFSRESGCRNLNFDVAIAMWRLLLGNNYPFVEKWIEFLEGREKKHDITKDTWEMVLDFLEIMRKDGISGYDPNSSWPVLIDEFVEVITRS